MWCRRHRHRAEVVDQVRDAGLGRRQGRSGDDQRDDPDREVM
jgi:hypothetical protein